MGTVPSDDDSSDQQSERLGSYCVSADVSASESCSSSFSGTHYGTDAGSSSPPSSPGLPAGGKIATSPELLMAVTGKDVLVWGGKEGKRETDLSEVEIIKERFAKLLLGEDMSGGGKGVCTALAISNAITNLSASVFGELWRLEPLAQQKKLLWHREMELLLCVSDSIVELVPSIQEYPGSHSVRAFEVMVARPRSDLYVNLPALRKLDAMLLSMLDGFQDMEFWYVDRAILTGDADDIGACISSSFGRPSVRQEDKWWLPCPRVPPEGLSDDTRKRLQQCRDCTNQILKAAMAINSSVLAEMDVPDAYIESLPKSGKSCLGDIIYRYLTADQFSPECVVRCLDLSSEHHVLEVVNRLEAAIHVWSLKGQKKQLLRTNRRQSWGCKVRGLVSDAEKSNLLAQRAESFLQFLRLRYPGLSQTVLDMNKIQYNKDVGQSILESYSRVLESLAFNIMARIDDLIYVDDTAKKCVGAEAVSTFGRGGLGGLPIQKKILPSPFSIQNTPYMSPFSTPTNCNSPVVGSPRRMPTSRKENLWGQQDGELEKMDASFSPVSGSPQRTFAPSKGDLWVIRNGNLEKMYPSNAEKTWSYAGNLSSRKDLGDAPERD